MRTRRALAGGIWAFTLALVIGGFAFFGLAPSVEDASGASRPETQVFGLTFLVYATVGAIVASSKRGNRIGWIFLVVGVFGATAQFCGDYAAYAVIETSGAVPGGALAAWLQNWIWVPALTFATTFLLLLFPTGRLLSRRWLPVAGLAWLATAVGLGFALEEGPIEAFPSVENPFGVVPADSFGIFWGLVPLAVLLSAAALVVRFRRSRGEERLQLQWFVTAAVILTMILLAGWFSGGFPGADALLAIALAGVPLAAGVAILKYRLWEIDLIVRRTLVYSVLTAGLAGLYFGIVIALGQIFSPLTRGNDLAIAGSTLAVAALFRPARSRIQGFVDRRFYRRRYDAEQTLAAFSARLREEVDLQALATELTRVVRGTVQPSHVSLWLRDGVIRP